MMSGKIHNRIIKQLIPALIALCVVCGTFAFAPCTEIFSAAGPEPAALYQDAFVNEDGTFNLSAEGFPADYTFDMSSLKSSWAASTKGFYVRVPKKVFQAIQNGGQTVTLIDGLGTKHIFRPEDIAEDIASQTAATSNLGSLYRKSSGYADAAKNLANAADVTIDLNTFKAWDNFVFLQAVSAPGFAKSCEVRLPLSCLNNMPGVQDSSAGGDAAYYHGCAEKSALYVSEYAKNSLTARPTGHAAACENQEISFRRAETVKAGDMGNIQYFIADRPMKQADVPASAVWSASFVKDGVFDTAAAGFPKDYIFDFSGEPALASYGKAVPKAFFAAVKASGRSAVILDGLGISYAFDAENIAEIPADQLAETVPVGARFRNSKSYVNVGKQIAFDNVGVPKDQFNMRENFGFVELLTGNGVASDCRITLKMDFGEGNETAADAFYDLAAAGKLYIYQYSSSVLTDRETAMAEAQSQKPYISCHKPEAGSIQLLFSDRPLKKTAEPEPEPEEPVVVETAPYRSDFVQDGRFVTEAEGFPTQYRFTFDRYSSEAPGFSRDLFNAIRDSGREVTLIDRLGIEYRFDGSQMDAIPAEQTEGLFQLQSLYKYSKSYQTVMGKIAGLAHVDSFFMDQDWVILDIQPASSVGQTVSNSFPAEAQMAVRLSGSKTGEEGNTVADRFAQYARDGKLKAFYYNKASDVQDIDENAEPLIPTADDEGRLLFPVKEPCTLIFTCCDLIGGRGEQPQTNPYEMVLRKDGKRMSDGYTVEVGTTIFIDLFMNNGRIGDHTYTWEVVGPGRDTVSLKEAEDAQNLCYELTALKQGEPFQVRVYADGERNNYATTGAITVTDSLFGREFVEDGAFVTGAKGFPEDYRFVMPADKYLLSGAFFNAAFESGRDVSLTDPTGITYTFAHRDLAAVPREDWNRTYPLKALYKDSDSYQKAMMLIAYRHDIFTYELNQDYQIIDFQAHGQELPFKATASFRLISKAGDEALAKRYSDLMKAGRLYPYVYSKKIQDVTAPFDGLTVDEDGVLSFDLQQPVTLVFSAVELMDAEEEQPADSEPDQTDDESLPETGRTAASASALILAMLSAAGVILASGKKKSL